MQFKIMNHEKYLKLIWERCYKEAWSSNVGKDRKRGK